VRQYQLYLAQERKLSPQSINTFVSAVQFVYLITLEMPWDKHDFPRSRLVENLPVVLAWEPSGLAKLKIEGHHDIEAVANLRPWRSNASRSSFSFGSRLRCWSWVSTRQ
jgi:hypothetical protein